MRSPSPSHRHINGAATRSKRQLPPLVMLPSATLAAEPLSDSIYLETIKTVTSTTKHTQHTHTHAHSLRNTQRSGTQRDSLVCSLDLKHCCRCFNSGDSSFSCTHILLSCDGAAISNSEADTAPGRTQSSSALLTDIYRLVGDPASSTPTKKGWVNGLFSLSVCLTDWIVCPPAVAGD